MRIAGGWARGRRLVAPPGRDTRPTPARVREALASMLTSRRGPFVGSERVLDLFAGTGALGLECLSRGAGQVTFVERERRALEALGANIAALGAAAQTRVMALPAEGALGALAAEGAAFDLVLCDPPFAAAPFAAVLAALVDRELAAPGAYVVCEHPAGRPPPAVRALAHVATRAWGEVAMTLLAAYPAAVATGRPER